MNEGNKNINAYDQVPIKSYSKDISSAASYNVGMSSFEPNFHSD